MSAVTGVSPASDVVVQADPCGLRARVRFGGGLLRPSLLDVDAEGARVALTATGALLLAGDHVRIGVTVGPGAWLDLVETSGTVAYDMRGGSAQWDVDVRLEAGARLTWHGQPFILAHGARVSRRTRIAMAAGARCCLRETLVLGRADEPPGEVDSGTRVSLDGVPLLAEDLLLGFASTAPGVLGTHRVVDTLALLGVRAPPDAVPVGTVRLELAQPGTCLRGLTQDLHDSEVGRLWSPWSALLAFRAVP